MTLPPQFKKPPSPLVKAAAKAGLAARRSKPSQKKATQPPEPQLSGIIGALRAAASREPQDPDKQKLLRALALIEQVQAANAKQDGLKRQ